MTKIDFRLVLTKALFKLAPTILISLYLWLVYSSAITSFHRNVWVDLLVFTSGLVLAFFLYSYQVRFSVTFLILAGLLYSGYNYLGAVGSGEFDAFYYSIAFVIYAVIFLFAWAAGFGFARFSIFPWLVSITVFVAAVTFVVNDYFNLSQQMNAGYVDWTVSAIFSSDTVANRFVTMLFMLIVPVLFYCIYIVAMNEFLRKMTRFNTQKFSYLLRRGAYTAAILLCILGFPVLYAYFFNLPDKLYEQLNSAEVNSASFLKKTYNQSSGTNQPQFDLQDYAQLLPKVKLSDETVFCTFIDNFYPLQNGGKMPLPVHFRRYVLNRYQPENEKFTLDPYPPSAIPNDLFSPSVKDVPIGFSLKDPEIEIATSKYQNRKNISSTVYIQTLAPDAYVAPNTGYSYQRLPVPPEDRATFTSVYQCSSLISLWNLPPFVYSSNHPELKEFREYRAQNLNIDQDYSQLDSAFWNYYTQMDTTDTLLLNLSQELTAGKETPYQKTQAIVDYFTGIDETGNYRFTYTLEPGSPKNPGQSFMHYFLFENKKGYCTYFAGATTLLLRAAGVPCRVVVGYAIYDRSNKNSGWYWVYADQGHAWLEVYFPSYGWVDFDTTPSDDTEPTRPPKPDATPPDYAREPVFAVLGQVTGFTSDSTNIFVRPYSIRYQKKKYDIPEDEAQIISLKPDGGVVTIEDKKVKIGKFKIDQTLTLSAYSFNYDLEKIRPFKSAKPFMPWFVSHFPKEIPVDEAIIVYKDENENQGKIFAVEGVIKSILPDSTGLAVAPDKIFFRGKNYSLDKKHSQPIHIKPEEAVIYVSGEKISLKEFAVGDSMLIKAESGSNILHIIKPFLATEPFTSWFKNSFPESIPVDRVNLEVTATPFYRQFLMGLFTTVLLATLVLTLLAWLIFLYFNWRITMAKDHRKLYWLYRLSLMVLNQLGFQRIVETPLEYAHKTIDPQLGTQLGPFIKLYHRVKYAPAGAGLSTDEAKFIDTFRTQFKQKVFSGFSKWQVLGNFVNFLRTIRFLYAK